MILTWRTMSLCRPQLWPLGSLLLQVDTRHCLCTCVQTACHIESMKQHSSNRGLLNSHPCRGAVGFCLRSFSQAVMPSGT